MIGKATGTAGHAARAACVPAAATTLALCGLLYYLAASLELRVPGSTVPLLYPQHGMLVALLMATRHERWWLIALPVLPAHLLAHWSAGLPLWQLIWQATHSMVLAIGIGATWRVTFGQLHPFESLRHLLLYLCIAVLAGPALLSILSPALALAAGTDRTVATDMWQAEFLASALAILTWGSCVYSGLLPGRGWLQGRTPMQYAEVLLIAAALSASYYLTFVIGAERHTPLYLIFLPLLWLSVRFGVGAAAMAVTLVATFAAAAGLIPQSMRIQATPQAAAVNLQMFLIVLALSALIIAVVLEEHRRVARSASRDITAREQAVLALRQSDERLSLFLRASYDVLYDWDIVRGEVWSSGDYQWSEPAPSGQRFSMDSWSSSIHPNDRERIVRDCREALQGTAATWEAEYLQTGRDGPPRWVHHRAYIVRDRDGTPVRMIGAMTDLSDRKNLEDANRTLERLARLAMAGQIAASIAHEMNQPLGAIRYNAEAGLLFLARERYDPEEFRQIFDDICRDDRRASDLIRRLRDLLQDHELRLDPLDINDIVGDVVKLVRVETRRRHTQLETQCSELPTLLGDSVRLQQVLLNLILNGMDAMSGLPESRRRIAIRTRRVGATGVQVEVVDRGCGIDPEHLPKIFDSFFTSKQHGMGLGLAIARSIVEAHGGRIWARNNPDGVGATLGFEIDSLGSKVMMPAPGPTDRYGVRLN